MPDDVLRDAQFLVDTNVISHAIKPKREIHPGIRRFFEQVDEERMYVSALTIGEIQKGIDLLSWPKSDDEAALKRHRLQENLESRLEALCDRFAGRIVAIDVEVARKYGQLHAEAQRSGKSTALADTLIAACALSKHLTIATADADFAHFGNHCIVYNPCTHAVVGRT